MPSKSSSNGKGRLSYHDKESNDPHVKLKHSSMGDLVRDQYTSRGKDYRAMRVHPRRANQLLYWVNSLGLNPVPVTEHNLHSSFCTGLLLADLVRYLVPIPTGPGSSQSGNVAFDHFLGRSGNLTSTYENGTRALPKGAPSIFASQLHIPVLTKKQAVVNVEIVCGAILRSKAFVFSERIPPAMDIVEGNVNRIYLLLDELFRAFVVRDFIDYKIDVPTMVARGLTTASLRSSQHKKKRIQHRHSLWHGGGICGRVRD